MPSRLGYLLEAWDDVSCDGANQSCDVIHEALRKTVLPGRLQTVGEVQVVDYTFNLKADASSHKEAKSTSKSSTLLAR